jgi:hypothetical protein
MTVATGEHDEGDEDGIRVARGDLLDLLRYVSLAAFGIAALLALTVNLIEHREFVAYTFAFVLAVTVVSAWNAAGWWRTHVTSAGRGR